MFSNTSTQNNNNNNNNGTNCRELVEREFNYRPTSRQELLLSSSLNAASMWAKVYCVSPAKRKTRKRRDHHERRAPLVNCFATTNEREKKSCKTNRRRIVFFFCVEQQADELHNIGDALRMSCVGTKTPPSDAASAATTTTLVISSAATTTPTPSDAKSINLPAPPVKNGHTTTWVSFSSVSVQLFLSFFLRQFPIRL